MAYKFFSLSRENISAPIGEINDNSITHVALSDECVGSGDV